jgi:hypothetical protein
VEKYQFIKINHFLVFEESSEEEYELLKKEKKEIEEVFILFKNLNVYELKIIEDKIIQFRYRNAKDKLGYERWSTEFEQEVEFKNGELSLVEQSKISENELLLDDIEEKKKKGITFTQIEKILKLNHQTDCADELKKEKFRTFSIKKITQNEDTTLIKVEDKYFKSICYFGGTEAVAEKIEKNFKEETVNKLKPMGYNQFLSNFI